jgi:hypothetical protein
VEPELCDLLQKQAERVNCNLLGNSQSSFWTSGQVNVAEESQDDQCGMFEILVGYLA